MKRAQRGIERLDSSVHCLRGLVLPPMTTHSDTIVRRRTMRDTHAVLVEQKRQKEEGIVDPTE
jgi:hypothetical protein